jgi:transposase, IS5 family
VEWLFHLWSPVEVRELPVDLAALEEGRSRGGAPWGQSARDHGRPTIPIERYLRLMVIKTRTGWGYETLVREVSDSLHLRRFCRMALTGASCD